MGIIAFVCGLLAIVSIPLGVAAIITGILGIRRKAAKGMAIAGIVMGSLGALAGLLTGALALTALPALQRGQQDTQVKNDVSAAASAILAYRTSNQGALPTAQEFSSRQFIDSYLADSETGITYIPGENCEGMADELYFSVSAKLSDGERFCID